MQREPQGKSVVTTSDCTVFSLQSSSFQLLGAQVRESCNLMHCMEFGSVFAWLFVRLILLLGAQYKDVVERMREVALLKKDQEFNMTHDGELSGGGGVGVHLMTTPDNNLHTCCTVLIVGCRCWWM